VSLFPCLLVSLSPCLLVSLSPCLLVFASPLPQDTPTKGDIRMAGRLRELLARGKLVKVFCVGQLCHPKIVEIVGQHGGFDAVWLDQEHVGLTIPQIEEAARAARGVGLDSFVRLYATDYATVMRPLEAGAGGVMAAQVRSAREAADVVRWAK